MSAIRIDGLTPGGKRSKLKEVVPLATPYMVQIFPAYACNFRCKYCIHSLEIDDRKFIADKKFLDYELYKKCIDDMKGFPNKIKMLRFAGTGEPLLHKDIAKMINYAKEKDVAESIDIVTNASLLTKELSDKLINSSLTRLRISIQGMNSTKYKAISKVDINYEEFFENIRYFYINKKNTKVYIKIIDCALENGEEEMFLQKFGDICDYIAIEHMVPAVSRIDYKSITNKDMVLTQNGCKVENIEVCPQAFYLLQINPDGNVVPCCSMETAYVLGNCTSENLYDIWNGDRLKEFRINQLLNQKDIYSICRNCQEYKYAVFEEDILDGDNKKILERIEGKI